MSHGRAGAPRGLLLATLVAASVVHFAHRNLPFALLPSLRDDLDLSYSGRAVLGTGFYVAFGLAAIPLGLLADRAGRGRVLFWGMALWILATAASAAVPGIAALVALRGVMGLAQASFQPASMALLSRAYPDRRRARVLGILNLGTLGGVVAGLGLGGVVGLWLGWRGAFVAYAVPGLLLLPAMAVVLMDWREEPSSGPAPARASLRAALAEVLGRPAARWLVLSGAAITFCVGGVAVFLVNYVEERFGVDQAEASLLGGAVGISSAAVGTVVGAWLADRLHERRAGGRPLVIGASALVAVPFGLLGLTTESLPLFAVLFGLFGVFMSMYAAPIIAALQRIAPPSLQATVVAVYITACRLLGDGPSPLAAGAAADAAGDLRAGLALLVAALAPAGLFALLAARSLEREARADASPPG